MARTTTSASLRDWLQLMTLVAPHGTAALRSAWLQTPLRLRRRLTCASAEAWAQWQALLTQAAQADRKAGQ
jgi:hypothetical protein